MMRTACILAATLLAGCGTTPVTPPAKAICVPLGNVTPAQQKAADAALQAMSPDQRAALLPLLEDWIAMRDADRACLKGG